MRACVAGGVSLFLLCACKTPSVNLSTAEPIKVEIDMRLDVYQHNAATAAASPKRPDPVEKAASNRRNRMADIQVMKNQGLIGEGQDGLLAIRRVPEGDYGAYVADVVREENRERGEIMKKLAEEQKVSLREIQKAQAKLWYDRAFKDEWVEVEKDGETVWIRKQG